MGNHTATATGARWIEEWRVGWVDGWTGGWAGGWMGKRMDEWYIAKLHTDDEGILFLDPKLRINSSLIF